LLQKNDIKAVAYHAGIDSKLRAERQDLFMHEKVQVIVATIAFGMGIDKPDIRFVIHYNIPKSIETFPRASKIITRKPDEPGGTDWKENVSCIILIKMFPSSST